MDPALFRLSELSNNTNISFSHYLPRHKGAVPFLTGTTRGDTNETERI
jgi:hypothetical protein